MCQLCTNAVWQPGRHRGHIDPFASATELLAAFRAGRVSSRDLTELYIRRIERGVLLGLPITLNESFNVAGLETPCGVPEWKGYHH